MAFWSDGGQISPIFRTLRLAARHDDDDGDDDDDYYYRYY